MKILHLFYDLMNLYGDYANVLALERALSEKGVDFETEKLSIDDDLSFLGNGSAGKYDFIYIGSGTERNQKVALEYLRRFLCTDTVTEGAAENLKKALNNGTVMLCTGNSFEMFGSSVTDKHGKKYNGIGLFDFETTEGSERIVKDIKADFNGNDIIGFINKSSRRTVNKDSDITPFFKLKQTDDTSKGGDNSNTYIENEGIISGGFYGTHIIGPLLIRNKVMADYFADKIINAKIS